MKKIIILVLILLTTGCYDYKELNDLAIIPAIGVDYQDNEFIVTFEILNDKKSENINIELAKKTTLVSSRDDDFVTAFENTIKMIPKEAYFYQLKLLILSENMAKHGIDNIADYLMRENKINKSFYTVILENGSIEDLLNLNIDNEPVISTAILDLIMKNTTISPVNMNDSFDFLINTILSKGIDITIPSIKIDDDSISLSNIKLFNDFKLVGTLDNIESNTYYILKDEVYNVYYEKDDNVITIYNNKLGINYKNGKITLVLKANGSIKNINDDYDLKNDKTYTKLSSIFSKELEEDILDLIKASKDNNSDFLGIGNLIYKKDPNKYESNKWKEIPININVELNVNRNGLLYEVIE